MDGNMKYIAEFPNMRCSKIQYMHNMSFGYLYSWLNHINAFTPKGYIGGEDINHLQQINTPKHKF